MGELLAFLGIALLVIVTPGQDTALTIRNTLLGGRRGGILTAAGVAAGQATWTLATSAGLAAVLVASERLFDLVGLAGAAYLIWLGAQALRSALRGRHDADELGRGPQLAGAAAFRQGLVSNLGNAKMIQFAGAGASFASLAALGLVFCGLTLVWLSLYALAVAKAGDVLRRTRVRRALDAALGAVLVGLGVRLAAER
jgi:threonine/homoserine/homoserine lactone efflux protein